MKKIISILLTIIMIFSLSAIGCSAENTEEIILQIGNPSMTVNGIEKEIDTGRGTVPVIINGRTLLPIRAVVEELGGEVSWNEDLQEILLTYATSEIKMSINSTTAYINGSAQTLDTPPVVINERTMLPIRFVAESFNFGVEWNATEQKITITKTVADETTTQIETPVTVDTAETPVPTEKAEKVLVTYFSCTGNTKELAEKIHKLSGGDIVEITPITPYTSEDLNYNNDDCRANQEINSDARPEIEALTENIEQYDTILIGYPIWWGECPPAVRTFLESYDFTGKTIMPFCTSGSSGISGSISKINELCPNSTVTEGFRGTAQTSDTQLEAWFENTDFAKPEQVIEASNIKLLWDNNEVIISLEDNATAKDFASNLPMTLTMKDYSSTEKIAYFENKLFEDTSATGLEPKAGDVTLYAPWGNLAIFYKNGSYSNDLIPIGHIESGLELLSTMNEDFEVVVEIVD